MFKNKSIFTRTLAMLLAAAAIVCIGLFSVSCGGGNEDPSVTSPDGTYTFTLIVQKAPVDGKTDEKTYEITTDKTNLADALLACDEVKVSGETGTYGLTIIEVDGESHDWTTGDGYYWAIYIGNEPASTGASGIALKNGATYKLVAESM